MAHCLVWSFNNSERQLLAPEVRQKTLSPGGVVRESTLGLRLGQPSKGWSNPGPDHEPISPPRIPSLNWFRIRFKLNRIRVNGAIDVISISLCHSIDEVHI